MGFGLGHAREPGDLLKTLLTFTVFEVFEVFEGTGIVYSEEDADAYLHAWSLIGHYLGVTSCMYRPRIGRGISLDRSPT